MVELLSPRGFISSLRYGIRSNFAVVINGRKVYDGRPEEGVVEERVAAHVRELLRT